MGLDMIFLFFKTNALVVKHTLLSEELMLEANMGSEDLKTLIVS